MEEFIETFVSAKDVWRAWERAYFIQGTKLLQGEEGKKSFRYKIVAVEEGKSFSILWKALFARLIFSHEVLSIESGSKIIYRVQIKGFFSRPVRFFLKDKIRNSLKEVLRSMVKELEAARRA